MLEEYDCGRLDLHLPRFLQPSQSICYLSDQRQRCEPLGWPSIHTHSQPTREKSSLPKNRATELAYQALTLEAVSGSRLAHTREVSTASSCVLILALLPRFDSSVILWKGTAQEPQPLGTSRQHYHALKNSGLSRSFTFNELLYFQHPPRPKKGHNCSYKHAEAKAA